MPQAVRVYPNGDYRRIELKDDEVAGWLAYNKTYRFGNALFLDGACQAEGYLPPERITDLEAKIKSGEFFKCQTSTTSPIRTLAMAT